MMLTRPRAGIKPAVDPVGVAGDLAPWLAEQAGRIEAANRLPDEVAQRLVEAGLFDMTVPRAHGGLEMCPSEVCRAVFAVARGCASSAWIVGLCFANLMMVGKFSDQAQREVFGGSAAPIVPMLTGGVGRDITARPAEGGVLLSGTWRYASGIDVASWAGLLVPVPQGEDPPRPVLMLVPQGEFDIDHGSWKVLGMRGTGSKTVHLRDVFVPEHRFMDWATLQSGGRHPECTNDGPLAHYPLNPVFALSVAAPTFGVAAAVAGSHAETVRSRVLAGTGQAQVEDRVAQISVASARAVTDLICDGLVTSARAFSERVAEGNEVTLAERAAFRMRIAKSASIVLDEAQAVFRSIGGSLLPTGSVMERQFRDLHAMCSHFLLQEDVIGELQGRLLLGLDLPTNARI